VRAFLTGASGFVGRWLARHLEASGDSVQVLAEGVDVSDAAAIRTALHAAAPDVVYHLAALTHVGRSWDQPEETFRVNALGTLQLLEAARTAPRPPRVLLVSSAEVYGATGEGAVGEDAPLRPVSPYAASKVAAEYLGVQAHFGRGLEVVRARPFNHVGPGQADTFVVSALARRIVEAEGGDGVVRVGNLSAARDLTDVRDVARAYRMLALRGVPGEVYNVCSGVALPVSEVFERLAAHARAKVVARVDPELVRPVDVPVLLGDAGKLRAATAWAPEIDLDETLVDVLAYWRSRLGGSG
jgi:GDP-4-dehydro-6-deoxy-D-mannose reductase